MMQSKTITFNRAFLSNWKEMPFLPKPTVRNIKMAVNYGLMKLSCALGMARLPNMPQYAIIDPSSICNLRCPLCPTGMRDGSREHRFLRFGEYDRIMHQLGDYLTFVYFTNWGEPFLNPDFIKMAKHAKKEAGIPFVSTSSNLNIKFSDSDLKSLVMSGLDMISVSVDGATQQTYEKYRRGGKLQSVIDNSKRIMAKKKELGKDRPFIVWNFFVFRHNLHEIESIKKLAKNTGIDALEISTPHVYLGIMDMPFGQLYEISKKFLMPLGGKYSAYRKDGRKKDAPHKCSWLWRGVAVGSDGSVMPCCNIYDSRHSFGNMLESDFENIWNGSQYQAARRIVRDAIRFLPCEENICAKCTIANNWI